MNFLDQAVVIAIHDRQLAEYGGAAGVRDAGLLDSALSRPQNKHAYGEDDPFVLAASYAFGIARNHPFLDGNKRTAWVSARTFLALNGKALLPDRKEAVEYMVHLAEGSFEEAAFAAWLATQPVR